MNTVRRLLMASLAGTLLGGSLVACSVVDLDENPPPTEATIDGLRYTLTSDVRVSESLSGDVTFSEIYAELFVENVTDRPITRSFGACPWNMRLYREGEWEEPVWDFRKALEARPDRGWGCIAIGLSVQLKPGEREMPRFWDWTQLIPALGGSEEITIAGEIDVEPGLYRVAGTLHPNGDPANPKAEIMAPEPVRITVEDLTVPSGREPEG